MTSRINVGPKTGLNGAGILVTRPARQAGMLAQQISALGGRPLVFPAIVILPPADRTALDRVQRELTRYDYAVFVSGNAVEFGVADPQAWPRSLTAFAPGPATATALGAVGLTNVRMPTTTMDSEGLLALPEFTRAAGKRVVIFRGCGGRDVLGDTLVARGAAVDYVDCYRRAKPEGDVSGLLAAWRQREIDAVTMTSSEGLDNLWTVVGDDGRSLLLATPMFVPHSRIAERARDLGVAEIVVTETTDAGLMTSLLQYFALRDQAT